MPTGDPPMTESTMPYIAPADIAPAPDAPPPPPPDSLPAPPKPKRKNKPRRTAGQGVVDLIDAMEVPMSPEERAKLLEIKKDEAMKAFLAANLGEGIDVDKLQANSIFSSWLFKQIVLPPMLMTMHLDNLAQAKMAVETIQAMLKSGKGPEGDKMTHEDRIGYLKTLGFITHDTGILLKNAQGLALVLQGQPEKKEAKPKNRAPDSLSQTNVAVQVNLKNDTSGSDRLLK